MQQPFIFLSFSKKNPEVWMSSEYIAGSINVNPVVVRKEIKNLKALGYIQSKEGKGGGAKLATDAGKLHLQQYTAV